MVSFCYSSQDFFYRNRCFLCCAQVESNLFLEISEVDLSEAFLTGLALFTAGFYLQKKMFFLYEFVAHSKLRRLCAACSRIGDIACL